MTPFLTIENGRVSPSLEAAAEKVRGAEGEVILDFSAVRRIDADGLNMMEKLARMAEEKAVKVSLRGVSMDVYKVLKLVKLARRFEFVN